MVQTCSMLPFVEIVDRAHTGPVCSAKEWDIKVLPKKAKEKVEKYGIKFDPDNLIPSDNSLADAAYQAGFELAVETGVLCMDTERIIKISEEELKAAIREAKRELTFGSGADEVLWHARKPEDRRPLRSHAGPFGTAISEDIYVPVHQAYAHNHQVDSLEAGSLPSVYGRDIKAGTPYEVLGFMLDVRLQREAVRRAGRPGMPITGDDATGIGHLASSSYGHLTVADHFNVSMPADLKTYYFLLNKVAHATIQGFKINGFSHSAIGGYTGGPESATVVSVAEALMIVAVLKSEITNADPYDVRYFTNSNPEAMWAMSLSTQAIARNTNLIYGANVDAAAGPCTDTLLYEVASGAINNTVSGAAYVNGVRPICGRYRDYVGILEAYLMCEVEVATCGMKREDANELVKKILPKYETAVKSKKAPIGKPLKECYDLTHFKPSQEWQGIYSKVKKDLSDLGIPMA